MAQLRTLPQQIRRAAPQVVVDLVGEVDLLTAPRLRERLGQAMGAPGTVVVLDASRVSFIDRAGLRELLAVHTRLAAGGRSLVVRFPSPPVAKVLEMTDLTTVLTTSQAA